MRRSKKQKNKKNSGNQLPSGFLLLVCLGIGITVGIFLAWKLLNSRIITEGARSEVVSIFPESVEGDWQEITNTKAAPEVAADGFQDSFSESNSAVYEGGLRQITFSNFNITGEDLENKTEQKTDEENARSPEQDASEQSEEANKSFQELGAQQEFFAMENSMLGGTVHAAKIRDFDQIQESKFIKAKIFLSFAVGENNFQTGLRIDGKKSISQKFAELFNQKARASSDEMPAVVLKYSVDGETWEDLDFFSEEISNGSNKGYFNYDTLLVSSWEDLKNLRIKVEGLNEEQASLVGFLDSLWVQIKYGGDEQEEQLQIFSDKEDWRKDEHPKFKIEDPQTHDSFLEKTRDKVVAVFQEDADLKVKLTSVSGEKFELQKNRDFRVKDEGLIEIELLPQNYLPPGNYILDVTLQEDGQEQTFENTFTWGLLAVNVNKSVYLEGETAHVQLAALDENGHTLCDANLEVKIVDPSSSDRIFKTSDGSIEKSETCGANNGTDVADYSFYYPSGSAGAYDITVANLDEDLEISDSFEVRDELSFEVERIGATRINPFKSTYQMNFNIKVNEDFEGNIIETVPEGFEIESEDEFLILVGDGVEYITWEDIKIEKDTELSLSYTYQAPEISPMLYLLGPLRMESSASSFGDWLVLSDEPDFKEARIWQVASDMEEASGLSVILDKKGNPVNFDYTDENSNESLIIKTDEKIYSGISSAEVHFSVTNTGENEESVGLQAYFPENNGEVKIIEKLAKNVPYETDVPEYGSKEYFCKGGWEKNIETEDTSLDGPAFFYQCPSSSETRFCENLSEDSKYCTMSQVEVGFHKEIKHKDEWKEKILSKNPLKTGKTIQKKSVSNEFKVKKSTRIDGGQSSADLIGPGETQYFRMEITFLPRTSGEFYIEAIGDKSGYGLLDPWWSSSWPYQKSITIDHDRVGIISDLSSNASSGQKNVVVNDGSLFAASDTVVIKDDSNEETATISSVSSNTLTMQDNLTNSYTTAANAFVKNTTDSTNLTNFPILVNLASDSDLASDAQDDGDDIAFTASDETTQLDHEIESFNGTTGELQAWVEVPTLLTGSDTVIYMYYGNGSCGTQEDIAGTWESNFKLVQHLDDLTTSTTEDSTLNNNDAAKKAANEPIETDGKIGEAQNFDGSNDYSSIANTVVTSPTSLTISSWFKKPSDGPSYECALHQSSDTTIGNSSYWLGVDINNYLTATIGARTGVTWSAGQTTTTATYDQWYHLAASWDGSVVRVYINGVYNKQYNLSSYSNLTTATRFGASSDGNNYQFKGIVDEIRISTAYRGPDWMKTSYNNQNSPSSFYSLGAEEGKPLLLEQSHYHWRNDDGSESTATSATSGSEDTVLSIDSGTRKRVRIEVSNEGSENSTDVQYRLEYGEKSTTCGAIPSWVDVGSEAGDWDISATDNLTDGNNTTNIAENIGGVTDENTTFETPNAAVKDTSSQTGNISLSTSEYAEIEYSIIANSSAAGKNYCFRLTDAGSATDFAYLAYAEAIIPKLEQIHYRWRNDDGGEGDTTSWYNGSWSYRKKITIDHTKVEDDHSDFPILVHLDNSETDFWSHCSSESELVFTQSNGTTKLKREVETFDHTVDDLYAWVKIPTMDKDEDLDVYLYYGNGSASEINDTDVWESNFKLVQHLDDLTTSSTEDSTSNNNDATKRAANEPIETDGKISKAQSFDGINDYDKIANNFITSPTSLTISSWIKKESGGSTYEVALHKASNANIGSSDYWLGVCTDDYLTATIGANQSGIGWMAGQTTTKATYGQWYHLAASWDGSVVRVYINGVYNKQYNLSSYGNLTTYPTRFGASSDGSNYQFKGVVDEMRISTAYRGDDWIKTSYNNQNDPDSFHTIWNEQAGVGATWEEAEDTAALVEKNTLIRVRFEISNEGSSALTGTTYRIEYGEKSSTCGDISSWAAVPDTAATEHWETTASANLTEGGATTNVAGGLTDEGTTFVAGETRETSNQTSGITLASTQFTEIEYSIQATNNATSAGNYCFRLTNAGSTVNYTYTRYAEVSLEATGIDIAGTVYLANETTQATTGNGGQCDSSTSNLSLRVNGGTESTTTCSSTDGSFTFTGVSASTGDTITIYSTDSTDKSNRVYVSDGTADTGMDLYKDTIALGDEQDGNLNILDTTDYDNDQNATDMLYDAEDTTTDTFVGESGIELHIHTGDTFAPGGDVTTVGAAGHLHLDDSSTFTQGSTGHTIGGDVLIDSSATLSATAAGSFYVGGSWTNAGTFTHNTGTVTFNATTTGHTITDGNSAFYDLIFNGSSGEWLYTDGTSTAPNQTTVQNGTPTFLNAKTGTLSVTGGTFNQDWYLGIHIVDADNTSTDIDTGDNDVTVLEAGSNSTVWEHNGSVWGTATSFQTTDTDSGGDNPQPNNSGAIRIREYAMTASASCPGAGCTLYKYNEQIAWTGSYGEYDYHDDYGENYLTSCLAGSTTSCSDDTTDDDVIGVNWYRSTIGTMNAPLSTVNEPPTNGSWHVGMLAALSFSIDSFSKDYGVILPGSNPVDVTNTLTASTSASHGYTVFARTIQDMTCSNSLACGTATISDWGGTNSSPTSWSGGSFGFGYSTNDYDLQGGTASRFSGPNFAGFVETGFGDPVIDRTGPSSDQENVVTYRIAPGAVQTAGPYQTSIVYVIVSTY